MRLICRGTDDEGQLYGFAVASGKRYVEQRKLFSQYLANTKTKFDEIIGDEASLICNKVYLKHRLQECAKAVAPGCFVFAQLCATINAQ